MRPLRIVAEYQPLTHLAYLSLIVSLLISGESFAETNASLNSSRMTSPLVSNRSNPVRGDVKHRLGLAVGGGAFQALNDRAVRVSKDSGYREDIAPGGWIAARWAMVGHTQQEFETGLMYWRINRTNIAQNLGIDEKVSSSSEFVAIPLVAKLNFGNSYASGWSVRLGVAPAALVSAKATILRNGEETRADLKDSVNSWDIFGVVGISRNIQIGGKFDGNFGLEYMRGLKPINGPNDPSAFHQSLMATLGFSLNLE